MSFHSCSVDKNLLHIAVGKSECEITSTFSILELFRNFDICLNGVVKSQVAHCSIIVAFTTWLSCSRIDLEPLPILKKENRNSFLWFFKLSNCHLFIDWELCSLAWIGSFLVKKKRTHLALLSWKWDSKMTF